MQLQSSRILLSHTNIDPRIPRRSNSQSHNGETPKALSEVWATIHNYAPVLCGWWKAGRRPWTLCWQRWSPPLSVKLIFLPLWNTQWSSVAAWLSPGKMEVVIVGRGTFERTGQNQSPEHITQLSSACCFDSVQYWPQSTTWILTVKARNGLGLCYYKSRTHQGRD